MRKVFAVMAALALLGVSIAAQANVFNLGSGLTNLEMVAVGDAGNVADTRHNYISVGSVGYAYKIGKYEVTAAQYTDFLNAKAKTDVHGLYNSHMADTGLGCQIQRSGSSGNYTYSVASDWANRPVNFVRYWDTLRFANWLGNGQGDGDTETGAYTMTTSGVANSTITRNTGWKYAVTSEDEWYKAAYYKGGGTNAGYWEYATQSDSIDTGMANYGWRVRQTTDVGAWGYASAYGTFDQAGNVYEWNEAIVYEDETGAYRGVRGGSFYDIEEHLPASMRDDYYLSTYDYFSVGFRVSEVPEPSSLIALAGGLLGLLGIRRRRR